MPRLLWAIVNSGAPPAFDSISAVQALTRASDAAGSALLHGSTCRMIDCCAYSGVVQSNAASVKASLTLREFLSTITIYPAEGHHPSARFPTRHLERWRSQCQWPRSSQQLRQISRL